MRCGGGGGTDGGQFKGRQVMRQRGGQAWLIGAFKVMRRRGGGQAWLIGAFKVGW